MSEPNKPPQTLREVFGQYKNIALAFVVGLFIGPAISTALGWQVSSDTLREQVHEAIVTQQAAVCEMRVREHVENVAALEADERIKLAKRYAVLPWDQSVDSEVVNRCYSDMDKAPADQADGDSHA